MNYGNRNATSGQTTMDIFKGYSAAVTSAVGISLVLRRIFQASIDKMSGSRKFFANSMVNWAAIATAGVANIVCMRMSEIERGITVYD